MASESFRLSRVELRDLLNKYEKAVEEDALNLVRPNAAERKMLGDDLVARRVERTRKARDGNRRFVEAVIEDIPDLFALAPADSIPRPIASFHLPCGEVASPLPSSSYGSMASVLLHVLRDWSEESGARVVASTYRPAVEELTRLLPKGGKVLLPGCGLGRLALELAAAEPGYEVEANDASRLFLTFADYLMNRSPAEGFSVYPLAHVFSENWGPEPQYMEVKTPVPSPASFARSGASSAAAISLVPGDFVKTYGGGCGGHRKFDAIVTCFFIDTATDVVELFSVMDSLLEEGGVWVNVGPLNWRKEARLKLCWEEVKEVWQRNGYEFVTQRSADVDYHIPRGQKMYTESYNVTISAAVKQRR